MRTVLLTLMLLMSCPAWADEFVPYTDGRAGGCFINRTGFMHGCTPQPAQPPTIIHAPAREIRVPVEDPRLRRELEETRRQLDAVQQQQREEQAIREFEVAQERARRNEEIRAYNAEVAAIEHEAQQRAAAREPGRIRQLSKKTEGCREKLKEMGYTVVGPGACKKEDGTYVNCPAC